MAAIIAASNSNRTSENKKIKSPGKFSPGIFTPIAARTRCQDPGRPFTRGQHGKRHIGPPGPPGIARPAHNRPVIFMLWR
jgi:hypothetical protein